MRKKWWEINLSQDEQRLFEYIARDPRFSWRTVKSVCSNFNWEFEYIEDLIQPFLKSKMILLKANRQGEPIIGYWEIVDDITYAQNDESNAISEDPNII